MSGGTSARVDGGDEGYLVDYPKSSLSRVIAIGFCIGGDGKKTISKSRTGRSSLNGPDSILILICVMNSTD